MTEHIQKSSSANFTLYPLFWLAICFACGITAAGFLNYSWQIYLILCGISAIASLIFSKRNLALIFLFIAFFGIGGLYFQIENQAISPNRIKKIYDENRIKSDDPIEIEGVLQTEPELAVGAIFLILKTEKAIYKNSEIKISGSVRLFATAQDEQIKNEYEQLHLKYGSRIRVACNLRREDKFLNPGVLSQTKLLDAQDIDATAVIKSPLLIEKLEDSNNFVPLARIYEIRKNLIADFQDKFSVSTAGVLNAALLGDKHFLDKPTAEVFRTGGTFHVLVISGLHITFIGGLILLFIRFFTRQKFWQFSIACLFLWTYSLAVGANVPVVRAAIMFTILLFSQVIYRRGTLLNAFGLCALILLVWRPNDIFTSSFQLTFASVGAIVLMAFPLVEKLRAIGSWSPSAAAPFPPRVPIWLKRFCETIYWREAIWKREVSRQLWTANLFKSPYFKRLEDGRLPNAARYIFEAILISLVVQAWLLPLSVFYFHRVSIISVLLNLWVGIVVALEIFAALLAVLFSQISDALALPVINLTEIFNWLLVAVPDIFIENGLTFFRVPVYSGAWRAIYFLYFIPIIFLVIGLNLWKPFDLQSRFQSSKFTISPSAFLRASATLFFVFSALIIFHPFSSPRPDGRLHVDFLDVGQGDSALITFPTGETLLVDGGGERKFNRAAPQNESADEPEIFEPDVQNIGERVVSNFLWEKGYSQIDYILATHADADHIQGLSDVAKNFRVRAAIFGRTPPKNKEYAELFAVLQKREIESLVASRGDVLTFGAVRIEVLSPLPDENIEAVSDNNHSIVLRVIYGARKFLLTGDIEKETERELLDAPEFVRTDVIKVAHHGSRTSSTQEFINASKAKLAIISVGRESPFGHPHAEVVERWKNASAKVLTTGENGTISVSTDGRDLQLKTFIRGKIYR
ncbi:MAG: ComEC/Rec2 family competence protein [Pyrinomonadaceae bacterium]